MARILLVDDNRDFADLLSGLLRREGHEVAHAADGRQALAMLSEAAPDLLVLDLYLPGVDGSQVYEELKRRPEGGALPVIFTTGNPGDAPEGPNVRCLRKPFEPAKLMTLIKELLA